MSGADRGGSARRGSGYTRTLPARGIFVSFEGIDGCGKSTQLALLASSLRSVGIEPLVAQEPGGTRIGRVIRKVLLDPANDSIDPRTELLLYFASRTQNLAEVIRPALAEGKVVLCDRFTDATVAYQGYGRGLGHKLVTQLSKIACDGERPDLTLWLDLDPETSRTRARARDARSEIDESRMEQLSLEFFAQVRRGYAAIQAAEPKRVVCIDASGPPASVARRVLDAVRPALERRGLPGI